MTGLPSPIPARIGVGRTSASAAQPASQRTIIVAPDVRTLLVRANERVIRV